MEIVNLAKDVAIGIDFGTTNSRVAFYLDKLVVIPNNEGFLMTPSLPMFFNENTVLSDLSSMQTKTCPINTINEVKRLIGRKFSALSVQNDMKFWPFKVEPGPEGKPPLMTVINKSGEEKKFYPEEICALILRNLKKIAEQHLRKTVKNAVISVPANFSDSQRQAIMNAGAIAGLNILRLINETSAAAIVYGLDRRDHFESNILLLDIGGGTLDISVVAMEDGIFEVKAIGGDTHLGGIDFDNKIVEFCVADFMRKTGIDVRKYDKAMNRLKFEAERVKRILSLSTETELEVEALADGVDYNVKITRTMFEELCLPLFLQCIPFIEKVLTDSHLTTTQIHDIVLIGGSTRIPKLSQIISNFFNGKLPNRSLRQEEAVVGGAAIFAAILNNQSKNSKIHDILLLDVTPSNIGISNAGGTMSVLISRGYTIPCIKRQIFTTYEDNQKSIVIELYEGNQVFAKDNILLGRFELSNIDHYPSQKGIPQIEVIFDIDANCILNVSARRNNSKEKIAVLSLKGSLSYEDIESRKLSS